MIQVSNVSKSFDGKIVLSDISCRFLGGTTNAICGPSGKGKTTLINIILGLIRPDSGSVNIKCGATVSCVFQEDRLIEHMTAMQNLLMIGSDKNQAAEALVSLALDPGNTDPVSKYSGGMRRRVAIARAVIAKPDILVLDEPFKGLDAEVRITTCRYILSECRNACRILITHEPEELELLGVSHTIEL